MKKLVMSAVVLSAVLSLQAQASMAVAYGFNKVYGEGTKYGYGESVAVTYNQPMKPGTFLNLNANAHYVSNSDVSYPVGITPSDYNTSFDVNVSLMQAVHDNVYVEAGVGTLFNQFEVKPLATVGAGILILETRTARVTIDMKAVLTTADYVKAYKAGKPDMMYVGQFRLFMPFDTKPMREYFLERYANRPSKPGRVKRNTGGSCYSF